MARRGYLELSPEELRARRVIFWGAALFVVPPLLTLCHLHQFICEASLGGGLAALVAIVPLFPFVLAVAALMFAGVILALLGAGLLLVANRPSRAVPVQ